MSFSSGVFSINTTGQPVVAGTTISATVFNALTADLATGLSTCILKDGTQTATAGIPFYAGTVLLPGIYLGTDTSSGLYRIGADHIGLSIAGSKVHDWAAGAETATGTLTVTGHTTFEGVTSTGATGTGKLVYDTAPTISGHPTVEGVTSTGATGTGKFVFDTSPTLVTPLLGTPTSGTLANCTGYLATALNGYSTPAWTPVLKINSATTGITYSAQTASCAQLGKLFIAVFRLTLTSKGALTGGLTITGLPVNPGVQCSADIDMDNTTFTGQMVASVEVSSPGGIIVLQYQAETGGISQMSNSNIADNTDIYGTVSFVTA